MSEQPQPAPTAGNVLRACEPDEELLRRNASLLCIRAPEMLERILNAPRVPLDLVMTPEGSWSGSVVLGDGRRVQLASLRCPVEEARRFAATVDVREHACVMVVGFGLGYHVGELSRAMRSTGLVVVFEPDLALLRAVLSRLDCSAHLAAVNVLFVGDTDDPTSLLRSFAGCESILAAGLKIVEHGPSVTRIGRPAIEGFMNRVAGLAANVRTHVVTTLCQVTPSVGNMLKNSWRYASAGTVESLRDTAVGRAGVVISAGPSLMRNIDLLTKPGVRDRVVLIAAQTTLKPLLARGIRPHFVTALDYSDISTRFYEGLTADDVRGITLVAEPKGSPAIFAAWPGELRCPTEELLDDVLGDGAHGMARAMGTLRSGSTVAHLSYYLARHLGCDPVILVGQDLAFTDGQYYSPGAAIHQVWSGELNEFNTLEMLEWQRVVRMRAHLHKVTDHLGRSVYTDEQMNTYRVQFEKDFAEDKSRGLVVIDATEGGVHKEHTRGMTLADALERYAPDDLSPWAVPQVHEPHLVDPSRKKRVLSKLAALRADSVTLRGLCDKTKGRLRAILAAEQRPEVVDPVIEDIQRNSAQAAALGAAYRVTQFINQTGMLRRFKTDRKLKLDHSLSEFERQKRQVQRDIENMEWLGDAADEAGVMIDDAAAWIKAGIRSAPAPIKDPVTGAVTGRASRVGVVIAVNTTLGGLGTTRDLAEPVYEGRNALRLTVARALASREACGVHLLTAEPARVAELLGDDAANPRVKVHALDRDALEARRDSVRAGRLWSRACWRGGLGNLTIFDEAFAPMETAALCEREGLDGVAVVGADWCLVDPVSLDDAITRHRQGLTPDGSQQQLVFVHAACGLGACVIDTRAVAELARTVAANGPFASIGALLGYLPMAPQVDPLGKSPCVTVDPGARDLGVRMVADHPGGRDAISLALTRCGREATLADLARAVRDAELRPDLEILVLDVCSASGAMPSPEASAAVSAGIARARGGPLALTLRAADGLDPLSHPDIVAIVANARTLGVAGVHVRTPLDSPGVMPILGEIVPDVVSIDLHTTDPESYERLTGRATMPRAMSHIKELLSGRRNGPQGLVLPWVVPRMVRRDDEYERIETFYDYWLIQAGACVIDPLAAAIAGERIAPLPVPLSASRRLRDTTLHVGATGTLGQVELKPGAVQEAA